jgi:hypothetical protein
MVGICCLFNDAVSNLEYIALNDEVINKEWETMCKEVVMRI